MKITEELLQKYAAGQCTKAEKKWVEQWLASGEDTEAERNTELFDPYKAETWQHLKKETIGVKRPFPIRAMRYAAALALLLSIGIVAYLYVNPFNNGTTDALVSAESYRTIESQRGEKRTLTLPDGSTIRMNYETEVRVPENFEGDARVVYLSGHAHFDVVRNPEKPFIIYTEDSKTQVLGTSFDINTSRNSRETEVIVTSGKVAFSPKEDSENLVTLTVNDRAILSADKRIAVDEVDAQTLTAWKDNQLIFEDRSLGDIITILEPWYNVEITVNDINKLNAEFTLSFDDPSLTVLLEQMSFLGDFNYSIEGNKVTIY